MKKYPKVSIIIPVIAVNDYIKESVPKILELDWPDFEILIFTDQPDKKHSWPKTKILPSGKVGPAEKRDLALKHATGEIYAFLDDDAYPKSDWLKEAIHCFVDDDKVAAVGGPAVTPEDNGVLQKVSGAVFESYLGGGKARNRYLCVGDHCLCEDWPSVNLLVRADVFKEVGGFDSTFYPGEDTKLCLDIVNKGYKIFYDPKAVVYHHRRSDLKKHFKQMGNYALHRGYFAKRYPKTSLKLFYFMPTFFVIYLIFLLVWLVIQLNSSTALQLNSQTANWIVVIPLLGYVFGLFIDAFIVSIRWKNPLVGLLAIPTIFLTHVWYGIRFVWGLSLTKLTR